MLPSQAEIRARYAKKETVADGLGRLITCVRLKLSETLEIRRMAETADATALAYYVAAASVRAIDEVAYPFPRNMTDLKATIDALDSEGIEAAFDAAVKLRGGEEANDPKASPRTPSSEPSAS